MAKPRGQAKQQQPQKPEVREPEDRAPEASEIMEPARNLPDAASADQSLQGYVAINALTDEEIAQKAYELYLERQRDGLDGSPDGDWYRAEEEVRRNRPQTGVTQ